MRRLVLLLSALAAFGFASPAASSFATTHTAGTTLIDGYVPVGDGTKLRMQIEYPTDPPRVPTLLIYQGYTHKLAAIPTGFREWATRTGYAVMVVSLRGAGCSGGSYDFLSKQEAYDGRDVIQWIIKQEDWSNGKVAMIGDSYTGFEMLPVAALRPPGLVAIAPGTPIADIYRDVGYPGGISNSLTPTAFSAAVLAGSGTQVGESAFGLPAAVSNECVSNQSDAPAGVTGTAASFAAAHRWDDEAMRSRAPGAQIEDIDVPTFTVIAWQDETLGSRAIATLPRVGGPFHAVLSNGAHSWNGIWYARSGLQRLQEFLDFYVRGVDNGFGARPPIEVWWESQRGSDGDVVPRWTSGLSRMPPSQASARTLFLSSGGRLSPDQGTGGPDEYQYVGGSGQYRGDAAVPSTVDPTTGKVIDWSGPPDADKSLVYTSAPLEKDLVVLGSGSLDLWLDSTASDTDVQTVLTEVRPDKQETYVQAGWLRASHRKLDPARSTATRPFHTHQAQDTQPLTPLKPERMRVEIRPFGHVFRAGSRLRLFIEAPPRTTGLWSFESLPGPALNRVYHDPLHASALTLETLPGHRAPVGHPECGTVIRQPCRTSR